jgi:formate hydrogenlyase subunit 3/multisubunit Na+/H+ antiporter MnhD subunit
VRKRRLLFLTVNLTAVLAAAGSVFLPWSQGLRPSSVALNDILPFDFLSGFDFSPNVILAIFIGTVVILLGALLASKPILLVGVAINVATVILWSLKFDVGWHADQFGHGIYLLTASILIATVSVFIPRRRKERKR